MTNHTLPFHRPPPPSSYGIASFPIPHVMLVVFTRPRALNAMTSAGQYELEALFAWFDAEPSLRCAVVTGAGRAFCAGMDLKEWNARHRRRAAGDPDPSPMNPPSGFGALSRRHGKKPVVAAVNGLAYGGGMEILANLDLVVASRGAVFALSEVKRGVVPNAGSLPRLVRTFGRPRTMQLALTGRSITAAEAKEWGLLNAVTDDNTEDCPVLDRPVVKAALDFAEAIASNSPDGIIIARASIIAGWEDGSAENASRLNCEKWDEALDNSANMSEGLLAFVEKRAPKWVDSKL